MSERNEHHYPPVNDQVADWGFYLTTVGRVLEPISRDLPRRTHPDMYRFDNKPVAEDAVEIPSPRESGRILPEFQVALITGTQGVFESDETRGGASLTGRRCCSCFRASGTASGRWDSTRDG